MGCYILHVIIENQFDSQAGLRAMILTYDKLPLSEELGQLLWHCLPFPNWRSSFHLAATQVGFVNPKNMAISVTDFFNSWQQLTVIWQYTVVLSLFTDQQYVEQVLCHQQHNFI